MHYVNKLSGNELRKLFEMFTGTTNIIDFWILTASDSVELSGKVYKVGNIEYGYKCKLDDYNIISNIHSVTMQEDLENVNVFHEYMLSKFGERYAIEYLLNNCEGY